jgi:hypothetical protein
MRYAQEHDLISGEHHVDVYDGLTTSTAQRKRIVGMDGIKETVGDLIPVLSRTRAFYPKTP